MQRTIACEIITEGIKRFYIGCNEFRIFGQADREMIDPCQCAVGKKSTPAVDINDAVDYPWLHQLCLLFCSHLLPFAGHLHAAPENELTFVVDRATRRGIDDVIHEMNRLGMVLHVH